MRVGIGLPAAVPGTNMTLIGRWATEAEGAGFESVGVIDRLMYDNLDPLTALAAAAACTDRVELVSTLVNVCWRNNAVLLAKQLSSVVRLSGGRLTIEGTARGTFTLIGADGAVHRESFEVGTGVLLWNDDAMTFLLQGAGSKAEAMRFAAEVDR
jgi:alkanesulfonate monooxygenase SsuD/methylene tetrahydromethanopterin reductase-like flavin-dependent oxidoreductase (luciferase family)